VVRNHVDDLALFRHAEVFARDAFDSVGGFLRAFDLRSQPYVFSLQAIDVRLQVGNAFARVLQLRDAAIAEEEREAENVREDRGDQRERPKRHSRITHRRRRRRHA
jgi:hypothetical protein